MARVCASRSRFGIVMNRRQRLASGDLIPNFLVKHDSHRGIDRIFLAFATARFQHDQVEILRAANPEWFIFHNLGRLDDIDFRGQFSTDVDFMGYDMGFTEPANAVMAVNKRIAPAS